MKPRVLVLGSMALALLSQPVQAGMLTVTSLSTILTEIGEQVGGAHVKIVPLVKAGMDPHEYEPKPDDLKMAGDSQLILACGKNLENYLAKLSESTGGKARGAEGGRRNALTPTGG